jgi:hypothetical protein
MACSLIANSFVLSGNVRKEVGSLFGLVTKADDTSMLLPEREQEK